MRKCLFLLILSCFLYSANAYSLITDWKSRENSKVRIVGSFLTSPENSKNNPKLILGVNFEVADGWKIYAPSDFGIGMPLEINFSGSKNYSKHQIVWPQFISKEEKIGNQILKYSVYYHEVVIPIEIELKDYNKAAELKIKINYGLCKDICIPTQEEFIVNFDNKKADFKIDESALSIIQKYYDKKITVNEPSKAEDIVIQTNNQFDFLTLINALIAAFIGGMILNIMPCVLPVLSLKLISIINHHNTSLARIRLAFLSTILGIIFCFIVFAILATIIKLTSNALGWGLQFQNPYFLIFLILVLTLFSASLFGLFDINFDHILATILNKKISTHESQINLQNSHQPTHFNSSHNVLGFRSWKNIFIANFLSGILAVLLATPCSAPFLGAAISFALVQDFKIIFLIFIVIALGVSFPYLILLAKPSLVYLLPKPGKWMIEIKKLMGGFLIIAVIWLVYVLMNNSGNILAEIITAIIILIFLSFKIKPHSLGYLFIVILIFLSFIFASKRNFYPSNHTIKSNIDNNIWIKFDLNKINEAVLGGKIVVIDITADWCITCKLNKALVLQDKEVVEKLKHLNIIAMRGDITKPNEEIMNFLRFHNRFAIPFNVVYGPKFPQGKLTSELLKKQELLDLINQSSN
jgi:suppressor for copper-sensitivity B